MKTNTKRAALCLVVAARFLAACKDKKDDDSDSTHEEGEAAAPDCQAITDACHSVDDGTGEIGKCHNEIAHENDAAKCKAEKDRCVALCVAAGGGSEQGADAGHGDAAH